MRYGFVAELIGEGLYHTSFLSKGVSNGLKICALSTQR